ncbi:MAG: peptidoglycan D,D-transpeptidase FtsI family protein [Kiloniellales bacterium]
MNRPRGNAGSEPQLDIPEPVPRTPASLRRPTLQSLGRQTPDPRRKRLLVTATLFTVAFLAIGARLIFVSLLEGNDEPRLANARQASGLEAGRADILDRNGVLLATTIWSASLYANPKLVIDPADAAERLSRVLPDLDPEWLSRRLTSDRSFVWIRRKLTPRQQYEINRLGIPGLEFIREQRRVYPHGPLAAHVLGYTNIDNRGIAGIEKSFDDILRGYPEPLRLSIDIRLQHIVHEELAAAVAGFRAIGGCAVVLDVASGEIISLVSLPDFDPDTPAAAEPESRFNRATLGIYELGSIFKLFTVAMALDAGVVGLDEGYDATRPLRVARFTITDYHAKSRWLTVPEILIFSSNIGAAKMARDVGGGKQRAYLDRLGMLRPASIELPEVGAPLFPARWREINTLTIGYGHGIAVSPLQLALGAAALVNGGILRPPTLLEQDPQAVGPGERVLEASTSAHMRALMRLVVERGTGRQARVPGYWIGGKTGTAEKPDDTGRYQSDVRLSSFVAALPIEAPRYVLMVMVDEPKGNAETHGYATGGWVAAPVVARIVERMAPLVGIVPIGPGRPAPKGDPLITAQLRGG